MKTVDKLAQKYALNINQIRGPTKSNNLDFKNLNKGFYDDIEKNDVKIKKDQKELKKLKDTSLKEFIYTNKDIPDKWKKKSNYEDDLLNIMINDKNILTYIGTCPKEEKVITKSYKDSYYESSFPKINNRYIPKKTSENNISKKDEINNINDSEIAKKNTMTEEFANDYSVSKMSKMKYKIKNKNQLNEKLINNILEDFKTAYPIQEKLQQLYTKTNYYNTNTNNNSNELNDENKSTKKGLIMTNSLKNFSNTATSNNTFFSSIKNQQQFKRKNVFRQNVFNNLIPNNNYSVPKRKQERKKLKIEERPFFGSDHQSFIKRVEIANPLIIKNLESINYYGPYFSHCPPCNNRNLDFYKNLEINQCLGIIHHIKKMRMKNTILDIKNSAQNIPTMESEICLDTKSIQSNENNNYLE